MADEFTPVVSTVKEDVPAQVSQPREPDADTSAVHTVHVQLDRVITDPSAPDAVQVPDAGKGSTALPAHSLDAPSVEQVFGGADAGEGQETERVERQVGGPGKRNAKASKS